MSATFDPYHKWLGIKPKDQPPNHYRLLGIELFESDVDVIDNAADQRMRHIRSLQTGVNAELSQQILNQIAAARICLTDPNSRAGYDGQLRAAQARPESLRSHPPPPPAPPPVLGVAAAPPLEREEVSLELAAPGPRATKHSGTGSRRGMARRKSAFPAALVFTVAGLVVVVVIGVVLFAMMRQSQGQKQSGGTTGVIGSRLETTTGKPDGTKGTKPAPPTHRLELVPLPSVTLDRGQPLRVQAKVRNPEIWGNSVSFEKGLGTPDGAKVDSKTGWLEWNPPRNARQSYLLTVEARAGESQDTATMKLDLPWGRGDLVFEVPRYHTAYPGEPLTISLSASDDMGAAQGTEYKILRGPNDATIDPSSSQFRWQAKEENLGSSNPVHIQVTDARGVSVTATFTIHVQKKPEPKPEKPDPDKSKGNSDK